VIAFVVGRQTLRRTGGAHPLVRGQGTWHQPPGWWWDTSAGQWRPPSAARPDATEEELEAERAQGLAARPESFRSWAAYKSFVRAVPIHRFVVTTAMMIGMDLAALFWPNLSPRGLYIALAGLMSMAGVLPIAVRLSAGDESQSDRP
jgi:hypothetical protein